MRNLKAALRRKAYDARNSQVDKNLLSLEICRKFIDSSAYQKAKTVMLYIHCRSEVRTELVLTHALADDKQVVIPYCTKDKHGDNHLGLWRLEDPSELIPGTWGILEPPCERWEDKDRAINPGALDLIMVPGVGFDRQGGRIGNGAGYYDRLLARVRNDTVLAAVCYESQLFPKIPMDKHDVSMDYVFTELICYKGKGR